MIQHTFPDIYDGSSTKARYCHMQLVSELIACTARDEVREQASVCGTCSSFAGVGASAFSCTEMY